MKLQDTVVKVMSPRGVENSMCKLFTLWEDLGVELSTQT